MYAECSQNQPCCIFSSTSSGIKMAKTYILCIILLHAHVFTAHSTACLVNVCQVLSIAFLTTLTQFARSITLESPVFLVNSRHPTLHPYATRWQA